ncbi:hypothetical protein MH928_04425 [Flavobacterium sp. WW92]|uniref:hypothetical protein n=1 Tax=unclassified Flavobacterium TaxID=196869 RepID=UPI002223F11D|nr:MULTISPECIES: hypothetical protein [unclassified Flavobacterium]WDO13948.1 hypothetical protein MH928_04425 [Flavobacterium sp. WW92]
MKSNFDQDLTKEYLLGKYLDQLYPDMFEGFEIERVSDSKQQHKGIDIILSKDGKQFFIDEKAQLDYLEEDLPTFAFEITYLKDREQKLGWLYDNSKLTDFYFTITAITCNTYETPESGFKSCKIFSINRKKLINLLTSKGLTYDKISEINQSIRGGSQDERILVPELETRSEGNFYFSKGKAEQPINIVLKLDFLIESGVAKKLH